MILVELECEIARRDIENARPVQRQQLAVGRLDSGQPRTERRVDQRLRIWSRMQANGADKLIDVELLGATRLGIETKVREFARINPVLSRQVDRTGPHDRRLSGWRNSSGLVQVPQGKRVTGFMGRRARDGVRREVQISGTQRIGRRDPTHPLDAIRPDGADDRSNRRPRISGGIPNGTQPRTTKNAGRSA